MSRDDAARIATDPIFAAKRMWQKHEEARRYAEIARDPHMSKVRRDEAIIKWAQANAASLEFDRWIPGRPTEWKS
jgi:hypothetical protein